MILQIDILSKPDDLGEIRASDLWKYEKMRVITDAHTFIVPLIWLAAALVLWFALRLIFAGSLKRLRAFVSLWFEAKEVELRRRAGKPD